MQTLLPLAERVALLLKARRETIAVTESSAGGLLSAALLAIPGASAYFLGGAVVYTRKARESLLQLPREAVAGMRSASEPYALLLARTASQRFSASWGLAETGAAGPSGNSYGDSRGTQLHRCRRLGGRSDYSRNRQRRPGREHARIRRGGTGTAAPSFVALGWMARRRRLAQVAVLCFATIWSPSILGDKHENARRRARSDAPTAALRQVPADQRRDRRTRLARPGRGAGENGRGGLVPFRSVDYQRRPAAGHAARSGPRSFRRRRGDSDPASPI